MSEITRLNPGPRMSQAVVYNGMIFLAGQVGLPDQDIAAQTQEAFANVDQLLAEAGSSRDRILQVTIWLADIADFAAMNAVYDAWVDKTNPPARATCQATLGAPEYLVEVIVVAAASAA